MKSFFIFAIIFFLSVYSHEEKDFEKTGRLPRDLLPYHYDLIIRPDINSPAPPFTFSGKVRIHFECFKETNVLHINSKDMVINFSSVKFTASALNSKPVSDPVFTTLTYRPHIDFASFTVTYPFVPASKYILELEFVGTMGKQGDEGLYWDSFKGLNGKTKYIAATQLESIYTRQTFPCMDEVDMKATFSISIDKLSQSHVAISNMPIIKNSTFPDGWTRVEFDNTPVMSTYLVCIIVGEFHKVTAPTPPGTDISISLYATERQVNNLEFMKDFVVTKMQKWFDDYTKFTYKEPKMDHVALPSKGGAMENWGLITYGEEILCSDKETSSVVGKFNGVTIVTHEIAHMWYGNLVTCRWWDDLWIQEGFATNYNYNPTEYLGWDWMSTQLSDVRRGVQFHMTNDQKLSLTHTVRMEVPTPKQSRASFTSGAYNKGGSVLRMLHGILTREVKEKAFASFLKRFAYSNAATKDLTDVLDEEAAAADITYPDKSPLRFEEILKPWLNIKGFPVVMVSRSNSTTLLLKQKLYLRPTGQKVSTNDKTVYSWHIPVTMVTKKSTPREWDGPATDWMPYKSNGHIVTMKSDPGWYILNPRQYFYYRVQYDQENKNNLVKQLRTDFTKILPETRSQLLEDYFEFARSIMEGVDVAMDFTVKLQDDFSHNAWQVALKHAHAIEPFISSQPFFAKFQLYFRKKLDKILEILKYPFPANETITTTFLRKDAISSACAFGSATCLSYLKEKYDTYITHPDVNSIDANQVPTVLCDGVHKGTHEDFQTLKQQYIKRKEAQVKDERHAYIFALTCSRNHTDLHSIFKDILGGKTFIAKDVNQAAQYLAGTPHGAQLLYKHMDQNWNKGMSFNKLSTMNTITNQWFTDLHVKEIREFIVRREKLPKAQRDRLEMNELQVQDNNKFSRTQTSRLADWINKNVTPSPGELQQLSLPPTAFHHWHLLEQSYLDDMVGKQYWE